MSLRTKQALADSLMKLLNRRTLNRITVSDITDDCGVNRQTFYYHFHDVYDLLQWMLENQFEENFSANTSHANWKLLTQDLYERLLEHKTFYLNVYHSMPNYIIRNFLGDMVTPQITKHIDSHMKDRQLSDADRDYLIDFFTGLVTNFLLGWLDEGMPQREDDDMDRFFFILDGLADWALERLSEYNS